ncbi:MAG TPA: SCO family protein [Cellvibrionaceae bacterium]
MKRISTLLVSLLFLSFAVVAKTEELKSGVFKPPRLAPDFTLQSSQGGEFKLTQTRGKLVVLGFGFTHCTEVCPVTLANLAQARKKLGDLAADMQVVYVTVDPENDTPTRMNEYLRLFDASFIGATGGELELAAVRKEYGIAAAKATGKKGEQQVHHSSYIYLIDQAGLLRALVPFGKSSDDIAHDVKILLQENSQKLIDNKAVNSLGNL